MSKIVAIYNPLACGGNGERNAHCLDDLISNQTLVYRDSTGIKDYKSFLQSLSPDDAVIICGGDGTLNHFINASRALDIPNELFYFACGTGNDFLHDLGAVQGGKPIKINSYIQNLPLVRVKGKQYRFLNNVGFGIDGYCCQVGDEMRAAHKENINYTAIAIKGLLGGFHPVRATVTVDGVTCEYKHVWLAPTMKGRFYGGGMMPTPAQDRNAKDHTVSLMVFHCPRKLKTLMVFPSIFQGEHIRHKKMVDIKTGHHIKVRFSRPCPLQIDGETILDVTEYEVDAPDNA